MKITRLLRVDSNLKYYVIFTCRKRAYYKVKTDVRITYEFMIIIKMYNKMYTYIYLHIKASDV